MSDEIPDTPDTETPAGEGDVQGGKPDYTPPATQADLDRIIAERLARERAKYADYDELKAKAAEHDKYVESQKSEQEKLAERAKAAEDALAAKEAEAARLQVLARHHIPEDFQDLVRGDTPEELEAAAEKVAQLAKPAEPEPDWGALRVPTAGKTPQSAPVSDPDAWIREAASS